MYMLTCTHTYAFILYTQPPLLPEKLPDPPRNFGNPHLVGAASDLLTCSATLSLQIVKDADMYPWRMQSLRSFLGTFLSKLLTSLVQSIIKYL